MTFRLWPCFLLEGFPKSDKLLLATHAQKGALLKSKWRKTIVFTWARLLWYWVQNFIPLSFTKELPFQVTPNETLRDEQDTYRYFLLSALENMYEQNKYHIQLQIGRMCCLQLFEETYKELHLIDFNCRHSNMELFWTVRSVPHPQTVEYTK